MAHPTRETVLKATESFRPEINGFGLYWDSEERSSLPLLEPMVALFIRMSLDEPTI